MKVGKGCGANKKKTGLLTKELHAPANKVNVQAVGILGPSHPLGNVRGQLLRVGVGVVATAVGKRPRAAGNPLGESPAQAIQKDVRVALLGVHHELPFVATVVVLLHPVAAGHKRGRERIKRERAK